MNTNKQTARHPAGAKPARLVKIQDLAQIPVRIQAARADGIADLVLAVEAGVYENVQIRLPRLEGMHLTLRAEGAVRLLGGRRLTGFTPVEDPAVLARLDPSVLSLVRQCDLAVNGIDPGQPGGLASRGFNRPLMPSHAEVFQDSRPLRLAQYPKPGQYLPIDHFDHTSPDEWGHLVGALEAGFYYKDPRPASWQTGGDIWVHGYWAYDWANSYEQVASLDTLRQKVETAAPYGNFYFRAGQRFCFLNILEELTEAGEYYIDRERGLLYFLPCADLPLAEMVISLQAEPVIQLHEQQDVRIEGFTIEATCGQALAVTDCRQILIKDCHFRNIGNYAVSITQSAAVDVTGCTIHDCGDGGIEARGGDRRNLEPANIRIHNNHIFRIAQWTRCYQPAIRMTGVGMTASRNLIHDCPHSAIIYWGNDMTIEQNEIYRVVLETGDAGAIYSGRDYSFRGNKVCGNFLHHVGGVGMGAMGIYNDDCLSGTLMAGNVFWAVRRAVFLGGGRDFIVQDNVFIDCYPAISIDSRGASTNPNWRNCIRLMRRRLYGISEVESQNRPQGQEQAAASEAILPVYLQRYPELKQLDILYQSEDNPFMPASAKICGNVFCTRRGIEFHPESEFGEFHMQNNYYADAAEFTDYEWGDFSLREDALARQFGHRSPDRDTIGLIAAERQDTPPVVLGRMEMSEGQLVLTLKNISAARAADDLVISTSQPLAGLTGQCRKVVLEPREMIDIVLALPLGQLPTDLSIEAYGASGSVRPARWPAVDPESQA